MIKKALTVGLLPLITSIGLYKLEPSHITFILMMMIAVCYLTVLLLIKVAVERFTVRPVNTVEKDIQALRIIESLESHIENMESKHALMVKYRNTPLHSITKRYKDDFEG